MELEIIMLSKISQMHKTKYCVFSLICEILAWNDDDGNKGTWMYNADFLGGGWV
jgi:hypothetical protein